MKSSGTGLFSALCKQGGVTPQVRNACETGRRGELLNLLCGVYGMVSITGMWDKSELCHYLSQIESGARSEFVFLSPVFTGFGVTYL